ncbi:MAG: hypothetical protein IJP07_07750 [Firmicutes bacterium]|nr:hypothetical protein [Bacillota bacterium]
MDTKEKNSIRETIQERKYVFLVYIILRLIVISALVLSVLRRDYESVFVCLLVLFLYMLPTLIQRRLHIELPSLLETIILFFIFAAEILGELQGYFIHYEHWDTILHMTSGFLCAAFGFCLVDLLNRNERFSFQLSPLFVSLVAFCFAMTIGVLWEFVEFACDRMLGWDMQKDTLLHSISTVYLDPSASNTVVVIDNIQDMALNGESLGIGGYLDIGLYDTMEDFFVNFIGALIFSVIGFFYTKHKGKGKFARQFIPIVKPNSQEAIKEMDEILVERD